MYWFIIAPYKSPPDLGVASHLLSLRCNSCFQMVPFQCHPCLSFCLPLWMAPTWTWLGSQKRTIGKSQKLQCICASEGIQPSKMFEKEPREKKEQKHKKKIRLERKHFLIPHWNYGSKIIYQTMFVWTKMRCLGPQPEEPNLLSLIQRFSSTNSTQKLETNCLKKSTEPAPRTVLVRFENRNCSFHPESTPCRPGDGRWCCWWSLEFPTKKMGWLENWKM